MRTMSHLTRGIGHFDPDRLSTSFVARVCCGPLGRVRSYQRRPFNALFYTVKNCQCIILIDAVRTRRERAGEKSEES